MRGDGRTGGHDVILVEDNADDEALALRALNKDQILKKIIVARDGAEAIEVIVSQCSGDLAHPALILLDLKLPKVDGLEVLRRIRADERTRLVPVVILTSSAEQEDILSGYRNGANGYVRKPLRFPDFAEAVGVLCKFWLLLNEPVPHISGLSV